MHVGRTMEAKRGEGLIFVNCMEKLTMNSPRETLRVRMAAALDAGVDGITLAAGLHLGSFALIEDHPRFRDVKLGIIVSSLARLAVVPAQDRPHATGCPTMSWSKAPWLAATWVSAWIGRNTIWRRSFTEIHRYLQAEQLNIPLIPGRWHLYRQRRRLLSRSGRGRRAGGDALHRVRECGLPEDVKQRYFEASEEQIEVNQISPTGYPMRMLSNSPAIGDGIRPNCEAYGYLLDSTGNCCLHFSAYNREVEANPRREEDIGQGQDLSLHADAQL
jgi:nitronate monooxygenase